MTAPTENVLVRLPEMVASYTEQYGITASDFNWDSRRADLFSLKVSNAVTELLDELTAEEQQQVAAGTPIPCPSWFRIYDCLPARSQRVNFAAVTTVVYFYAHVMNVRVWEVG